MKTLEDHKELDTIVDAIQSELPIFRNGETYLPLQVNLPAFTGIGLSKNVMVS